MARKRVVSRTINMVKATVLVINEANGSVECREFNGTKEDFNYLEKTRECNGFLLVKIKNSQEYTKKYSMPESDFVMYCEDAETFRSEEYNAIGKKEGEE